MLSFHSRPASGIQKGTGMPQPVSSGLVKLSIITGSPAGAAYSKNERTTTEKLPKNIVFFL
jgi:hypothetical protein